MKKTIMFFAFIIGMSVAVSAQSVKTEKKKATAKTEQMQLKDHVCTDACHEKGSCVMAHGEKGHTCTKECADMAASKTNMVMKDHVCTEACKAKGSCVLAHGEKGHVCTDACKK